METKYIRGAKHIRILDFVARPWSLAFSFFDRTPFFFLFKWNLRIRETTNEKHTKKQPFRLKIPKQPNIEDDNALRSIIWIVFNELLWIQANKSSSRNWIENTIKSNEIYVCDKPKKRHTLNKNDTNETKKKKN